MIDEHGISEHASYSPVAVLKRVDNKKVEDEQPAQQHGMVLADGNRALVIVNEPTFPGCLIPARPIGMLDMHDDKGDDEKILAVPLGDPRFDEVIALEHLSPHWLREIENFFQTYKTLEDRQTETFSQ